MTPKEKAEQLVDRFRNVDYLKDFEGMDITLAEQCALIAVDEIISNNTDISKHDYWIEVKQEIENL